jgi:hypothetical protein
VLGRVDGTTEIVQLATADEPFRQFRFFGIIGPFAFDAIDIRHQLAEDFTTVDAVLFRRAVAGPPSFVLMIAAASVMAARRVVRRPRARRSA